MDTETNQQPTATADMQSDSTASSPKPQMSRLDSVRELILRGHPEAIPRLHILLDDCPEVWQDAGDLARRGQHQWIERIVINGDMSKAMVTKASIARKVEALKAELAGPDASPLEKLMIERLATCWLAVEHADLAACHALGTQNLPLQKFCLLRQEQALKRFNAATEALARIRRLQPRLIESTARPAVTTKPPVQTAQTAGKVNGANGTNGHGFGGRLNGINLEPVGMNRSQR
jgi:hypothetical protein